MAETQAPSATSQSRPVGILRQQSMENPASPSSLLGLNYAVSPRSDAKSVCITGPADAISPLILGTHKSSEDLGWLNARPVVKSPRMRRMSGRLSSTASPALKPLTPMFGGMSQSEAKDSEHNAEAQDQLEPLSLLVDQISAWIKEERKKRSKRQTEAPGQLPGNAPATPQSLPIADTDGNNESREGEADLDLDKLESIVKQNLISVRGHHRHGSASMRRKSSIRKLRRKASGFSSDTDYHEGEYLVPSCDAVLDNSKTLAYTGGAVDSSGESSSDELAHAVSFRDQDAWASFKFEIVRLAHTLRLKGWRKVPMDMSDEITVQRLSGALTNAVYVVSPPENLPSQKEESSGSAVSSRQPPKLLLRIYGPQVEHLIDREAELAILRRLARKRIGPRMLGTFGNGRFEEFFHAQPLCPEDLRNSDTSRQIAKRMRELHDGMELLDQERDEGPFVWRNWDKWLSRVGQIVSWMDEQVKHLEPGVKPTGSKTWLRRGHILGVPWAQFFGIVQKYRDWLREQYGSSGQLRDRLVFAHNDTQYGNILRLVPTGESPLLLPANTHKQLVVIDFEYASANTRGLEFANHFTEWCYNYHDKRKPYACNVGKYPNAEEQDRFIRAYVRHRPQFNYDTPKMSAIDATDSGKVTTLRRPTVTNSLSELMLDARMPRNSSGNVAVNREKEADVAHKASEDLEVSQLLNETRIWRLANTVQWIAWGIVQAKIPGMPAFETADAETAALPAGGVESDETRAELGAETEGYRSLAQQEQQQQQQSQTQKDAKVEEQEEEFDYLGYAQHRCMFFWGDALQLGLVKAEELPEDMLSKVKHAPL